jgi:cellulose synthase/poly-beta-1,6-N-acetylglucosamine synthase-like glycosyltransferase
MQKCVGTMTESLLFASLASIVSVPAWSLLALTLAARREGAARLANEKQARPRVAVLVPAHNESQHVIPTIACIRPQLQEKDQLIVIADNCSDDTAEIARRHGATVIERHHDTQRGKGFALAYGVDHLRAISPDVVFIIDADCTLSDRAIDRVAPLALSLDRPVQMLNLMHAPAGSGVRTRILEFAWIVKNLVRPLGSYRLGRSCHLMGTGMAIPWHLIAKANLATGHIAEDMKLGIEMALDGRAPAFTLEGEVKSEFPDGAQTSRVQKTRWEHGHLSAIAEEMPTIAKALCRRPNLPLLMLGLDLLIPPLALYVFIVAAGLLITAFLSFWLPSIETAFRVLVTAGLSVLLAVGLAWYRFGKEVLSLQDLLQAPLYALWKIPVYLSLLARRRSEWIRTKRKSE